MYLCNIVSVRGSRNSRCVPVPVQGRLARALRNSTLGIGIHSVLLLSALAQHLYDHRRAIDHSDKAYQHQHICGSLKGINTSTLRLHHDKYAEKHQASKYNKANCFHLHRPQMSQLPVKWPKRLCRDPKSKQSEAGNAHNSEWPAISNANRSTRCGYSRQGQKAITQ